MRYTLSQHASEVLAERGIRLDWLEQTLDTPQLREPDPDDPQIERRYLRIPAYGDRVLRVVVNVSVEPERVVSVFFDRGMKRKL